ncbi:hypothetical protein A9Q81_12090 [Gammaproteobacteria bacterium 42_54_T18]|nr:hypothetical protein A9Q81_12090 [Gammaproteobacteria bacterium 42_54_T18]
MVRFFLVHAPFWCFVVFLTPVINGSTTALAPASLGIITIGTMPANSLIVITILFGLRLCGPLTNRRPWGS